jgi:uncharacterized protein (DUF2252 family)
VKTAKKALGNSKTSGESAVEYAERMRILERAQHRKMAQSAHRYVRGSTVQFYEWLLRSKRQSVPDGPPVWICGDCHLGNLGPVANHEGKVEIEIRDVDQTVIGNPAHDLVRLALSLASAARGNDLPGVTTAHMMEHMMEGYQQALKRPSTIRSDDAKGDALRPIANALRVSMHRRWRHLADERIEGVEPVIPLGKRFWALREEEREAIENLFVEEATVAMIRRLAGDDAPKKVAVVDAAYWMKGCSSLGKLRYAVLLGLGKGANRRYRLIDIKEAVKAAAPGASRSALKRAGLIQPADFAQRVVTGARALSPFLGERMLPATLLHRPVVLRELMPQDLKLEMERMTCDQAVAAARFLAAVVGRAHARQMDAGTRKRWNAELDRHRPKTLDAPSWLWNSVVELLGEHEAAYLQHCRRYALAA